MSEKLKTLKGLSEDVSESDLLRCRIEQQAELIYILKQRADEYLKKYMEVEDKTGWYSERFVRLVDMYGCAHASMLPEGLNFPLCGA